jgi:hypothetical protein
LHFVVDILQMVCYSYIMKQILEHSDLYKDFSLWDFSREALILDRVMKGKTEMETGKKSRRARFEFYREKRVGNAVSAIKLCQNMSNKNSYEYTEDEAKKIVKYLKEAIQELEHSFKKNTKNKDTKYFD